MKSVSTRVADYMRSVQGIRSATPTAAPTRTTRAQLSLDEHLRTIRTKLTPAEQAVFDRGIERMRQVPEGLARIAGLSVDDVIADLRFEMRRSPLIPSLGDR